MPPMRSRALVAAVVACLTLGSCGEGSKTTTFSDAGAGFTFRYPSDFSRGFANVGAEFRGRAPAFRAAVGLDSTNVLVVSRYAIKRAYESYGGYQRFQPYVDTAVRTIARADKARITGSSRGKLGDLDAYVFDLDLGDGRSERLVFGFRGTNQYFLRCNRNAAQADRIKAACADAQSTFAPTSAERSLHSSNGSS